MITQKTIRRNWLLATGLLLIAPSLNSAQFYSSDTEYDAPEKVKKSKKVVITVPMARQDLTKILDTIHEQLIFHRDVELNQGFSPHDNWEKLAINNHVAFDWINSLITHIFTRNARGVEALFSSQEFDKIASQMPTDQINDLIFVLTHCKKLNNPFPITSKTVFILTCCSIKKAELMWQIEKLLNASIQKLEQVTREKQEKEE